MLVTFIKKSNLYFATLFLILIISCIRTQKINEIPDSSEKEGRTYNSETDLLETQVSEKSGYILFPAETLDSSDVGFVIKDDYIYNIPATSYNNEYVLVKFYNYSCCYHDGDFLRLYRQNKEVQTIQTAPGEDDFKWTDATFDSIETKVIHLMNARSYYTMTAIQKYNVKIVEKNPEAELSIEIFLNDEIYESNSFKMDSVEYKNSGCCIGHNPENDYECKISPRIINIWTDLHKKMILLEYGILQSSTGCDRGPFFKTVDLKNK